MNPRRVTARGCHKPLGFPGHDRAPARITEGLGLPTGASIPSQSRTGPTASKGTPVLAMHAPRTRVHADQKDLLRSVSRQIQMEFEAPPDRNERERGGRLMPDQSRSFRTAAAMRSGPGRSGFQHSVGGNGIVGCVPPERRGLEKPVGCRRNTGHYLGSLAAVRRPVLDRGQPSCPGHGPKDRLRQRTPEVIRSGRNQNKRVRREEG